MSFTSFTFLCFITAVFFIYYAAPKKFQWVVLLGVSLAFYWICSKQMIVWIILTTLTVYFATNHLQTLNDVGATAAKGAADKEAQASIRTRLTGAKRGVVTLVLLINFAILAATKYGVVFQGAADVVTSLLSMEAVTFPELAMPLGISFYTFQTAGYVIDVYRGKQKAETNFFKLLLFTSFFPQIMQGPISRYNQLAPQLYAGHPFSFEEAKRGIVRIGWGFVKKLVLADRLFVLVDALFKNSYEYGGAMMLLASILYGFHIYADFSSGIDITLGVARVMGIQMTPNFRQPYFATSLSDFWRRWHMTLGGWMRDYLFYPITMSKLFGRFGKWIRKHLGARWNKVLISGIGSFIIFTVVGIWHGPEAKYTVYGLYNGFIIMLSTMLEPWFEKAFEVTKINRKSHAWHGVQIVRTFLLVAIGRCIVRSVDVPAAFTSLLRMITAFNLSELALIPTLGLARNDFMIIGILLLVQLAVDMISERTGDAMQWLQERPIVIRWAVYLSIVFALLMLVPVGDIGGDFVYAKF